MRLRRWLAIGGANLDVKGGPHSTLRLETSNPGVVRTAAGGVARNVAENVARLGEEVALLALVGEDNDGEWLRQETAASGVSTAGMFRLGGQRTGRYLSVHNESGELVVAIADMEINEAWDDTLVNSGVQLMDETSGVFLEANLPRPVMEQFLAAAHARGCPIAADSVSVKKAEKWCGLLRDIALITPSKSEAEVLTGLTITDQAGVERAAASLLQQGVQRVIITCGADGVYLMSQTESCWLPAPRGPVHDVTGAGDAFTAGVMYGFMRTDSLIEQAAYGLAMAGMTLASKHSVAHEVNADKLNQAKEAFLRETGYQT
ncbi:carbohydrate kinase family protein [Brevibacillus humidisoli]|uniref:carbohydrate kinase family protein n=1 Tax=Brevibacillus humidisoli TaxID=2895522 RepID=UPI001E447341|nr:carbohydrate kinase family protein [Brevibacillus humidisoli]UFJ41646.1 carbohydrate kinase family protein [Brevibacillus humidisoli]